jgi:hypothetical protein
MIILIAVFLFGIMALLAHLVIHVHVSDVSLFHGCSKAHRELLRTTQEELARTQAELASLKAKGK